MALFVQSVWQSKLAYRRQGWQCCLGFQCSRGAVPRQGGPSSLDFWQISKHVSVLAVFFKGRNMGKYTEIYWICFFFSLGLLRHFLGQFSCTLIIYQYFWVVNGLDQRERITRIPTLGRFRTRRCKARAQAIWALRYPRFSVTVTLLPLLLPLLLTLYLFFSLLD